MEENHNTEYPVSTFKVDFGCSKGCPNDIRNMLQKLKEVKSMSIDPKEGKVTVVGNVNPTTLIKCFEEIGRHAQLCSFEKEPKKSHQSHGKHKHHSHFGCDCEDEFETEHSGDHHMHGTRHGHGRRYGHNERDQRKYDFGYEHSTPPPPPPRPMIPPPMTGYHPPPPPPAMTGHHYQEPLQGYHHPPSMPLNQHMAYPYGYGYARPPPPPMYPTRPLYGYYGLGQPIRPSYGYYGSRLPRPNPMVNYADYYCYRW